MLAFFAVGTTPVAEQHQKAREPSLFTSEFILASTEAISLSSAQKESIAALVLGCGASGETRATARFGPALGLLAAPQVDESAVTKSLGPYRIMAKTSVSGISAALMNRRQCPLPRSLLTSAQGARLFTEGIGKRCL